MMTFVVHFGDQQRRDEIEDRDFATYLDIMRMCKAMYDVEKFGFSLCTRSGRCIEDDAGLQRCIDEEKSNCMHLYLVADSIAKPLPYKIPCPFSDEDSGRAQQNIGNLSDSTDIDEVIASIDLNSISTLRDIPTVFEKSEVVTNKKGRNQKHSEKKMDEDESDREDSDFIVSDEEFVYTDSEDDEWLKDAVDEDKMQDQKLDGLISGNGVEDDESDLESLTSNESVDLSGSDGEVSVEEDGVEKKIKLKKVDPNFGMRGIPFRYEEGGRVKLKLYHIFKDVYKFREILREHSVWEGVNLSYTKNQKHAVAARCAYEGCKFYVWASKVPCGENFMIKRLVGKHTCVRCEKVKGADYHWIAKVLMPWLRADSNMSLELMYKCLKDPYGVEPNFMKLWRGRTKAIELIEGSHSQSFLKLPKYGQLLMETNPGSIVKIGFVPKIDPNDTSPRVFQRIFICLKACIDGFVAGCRPFIGLDGCHLKGPFQGSLLAAVSVDGNKGIFPIAYAVVEMECNESWDWFLDLLKTSLGGAMEGKPLTFMSDRQKGIINAVEHQFHGSVHRKCARHIYANFRSRWPSMELRSLFWTAAKSFCSLDHDRAIKEIGIVVESEEPIKWLNAIKKKEWSRWTFDEAVKCDHTTNNMTESFNHWIGKYRNKPILTLLEHIRIKLMARFHKRYAKACTWEGRVTPKVKERLEKVSKSARYLRLVPASKDEFQVFDEKEKFSVNFKTRTCSCREWMISGIPCKHVACCVGHTRGNLENLCDEYFTVKKYLVMHKQIIHPLYETNLDPMEGDEVIQPPKLTRKAGRPKKLRAKEKGEARTVRSRACTVKCKNCKKFGHNSRTCTEGVHKAQGSTGAPSGNTAGRGETSLSQRSKGSKRRSTSSATNGRGKKGKKNMSQGLSQEIYLPTSQPQPSQSTQ